MSLFMFMTKMFEDCFSLFNLPTTKLSQKVVLVLVVLPLPLGFGWEQDRFGVRESYNNS